MDSKELYAECCALQVCWPFLSVYEARNADGRIRPVVYPDADLLCWIEQILMSFLHLLCSRSSRNNLIATRNRSECRPKFSSGPLESVVWLRSCAFACRVSPQSQPPCGSSFRLTLPRLFWYPNRILRFSRRFKSTTWNHLVPSKFVLDAPDEHGFQPFDHIR
jgi:hypothetical protein